MCTSHGILVVVPKDHKKCHDLTDCSQRIWKNNENDMGKQTPLHIKDTASIYKATKIQQFSGMLRRLLNKMQTITTGTIGLIDVCTKMKYGTAGATMEEKHNMMQLKITHAMYMPHHVYGRMEDEWMDGWMDGWMAV